VTMENWVGSLLSTKWHGLFESPPGCSGNSNVEKGHVEGSSVWTRFDLS